MKHALALLAIPLLAACGDAANESDDPPAAESEQTAGASIDPASTATPALPDEGLTDPAATNTAPPPVVGTSSPANGATVPPTNQDAQYQDSVTEAPEAAP
jgi:hypothetical protein